MTSEELLMKYENQWVFLSKEMIDYMLDENTQQLPQQEIFGSKGSDATSDFDKPFMDFVKQYFKIKKD
jgi:hypothetical protein